MDKKTFEKTGNIVIIALLFVLAFFILKPILLSTIAGLLLAFIFYPLYKRLCLILKSKTLSALILCVVLVLIILIPLIFIAPIIAKQIFELFIYLQRADFITPLKNIFPTLFKSQQISQNIVIAIESFASKLTSVLLNSFTNLILNSMTIMLHFLLILFVFFFGLRDGEKFVKFIKSISPLSKESEEKVFRQFKDITQSVIFGQIIIGIVQGIVTGIGLFIFGVPNALTLTLLATFVGILPIIGPFLVWAPVDVYLFMNGRTFAGIGLLIYGLVVITWIDTIIRPFIVSKKTKIHPTIVLISMLGGLFVFGILGLILGPLVISYLLLLLEFYKKGKLNEIIE